MRALIGADERTSTLYNETYTVLLNGRPMASVAENSPGCSVFPPPHVEGEIAKVMLRKRLQSNPFFMATLLAVCVNGRLRWVVLDRHRMVENRVDNLFPGHKTLR